MELNDLKFCSKTFEKCQTLSRREDVTARYSKIVLLHSSIAIIKWHYCSRLCISKICRYSQNKKDITGCYDVVRLFFFDAVYNELKESSISRKL